MTLKKIVTTLVFVYFGLIKMADALPEDFKQAVSCYGNTHTELIEPACSFRTIIAVRQMWATSKLKSTNCPGSIQSGMTYNQSCCQIGSDDCKLEFDKTKRTPYLECTGKIECSVGTDWQQMVHVCGSLYLENSNIQSMDYNCITSSSIMNFNVAATQTGVSETYIFNQDFPTKLTSTSGGVCYVTSCNPGIKVGLIDLRLSQNGGLCGQKLTIKDGATTTEVSCDQNNDLTWTEIYTSVTSSIYITFTVTSDTPDAFIWIDVAGEKLDAYCRVSEAFTPSSEPVCTTTTTTTTPTTTTTSATTATHQNATSVEETTTVAVTTTKPKSGVDSTLSQVIQPSNGIAIAALSVAILALLAVPISAYVLFRCLQRNKTAPSPNGGQPANENVVRPTSNGEGDQDTILHQRMVRLHPQTNDVKRNQHTLLDQLMPKPPKRLPPITGAVTA